MSDNATAHADVDPTTTAEFLRASLAAIEANYQAERAAGNHYAAQDAGWQSLTRVINYLHAHQMETRALVRVHEALMSIALGSAVPEIFASRKVDHRRPPRIRLDALRGGLAAIMEWHQKSSGRKEAREWVCRHIPTAVKTALGDPKPKTLDSWLYKWGGVNGGAPDTPGRNGYARIASRLAAEEPDTKRLLTILESLENFALPAMDLQPPTGNDGHLGRS